ncbi:MerR family transcriptional regulator [Motilibacter aurantiacus]|uniref:MerR family transcriptional regulator n=1 Tax=Motilibacter aurantiacus TaxID=2714955 RepID=UPI00140DD10B|nr:MerR family transcriptional regulator [Motilibacter aurantiacus]
MGHEQPGRPVGEVARLAGVSVRALRHYDAVGVLRPSGRTAAGYRVYDADDIARLQGVLAYRALGVPLREIPALLDDPGGRLGALRRQHRLLQERIEELHAVARTIEKTMEAHEMGIRLTPEEMLEVFGDADPTEHATEAEERWGDTDAYRESRRRTSEYSKEDWLRAQEEAARVEARYAAAYDRGLASDGPEAVAAAEAHRAHISRWFYECSHEMHSDLGEMYISDPRFTEHYDRIRPGLARWVRDAIDANARGAAAEAPVRT